MSPDEGQEEFDEVSEELRKKEEVVCVKTDIVYVYIVTCQDNNRSTVSLKCISLSLSLSLSVSLSLSLSLPSQLTTGSTDVEQALTSTPPLRRRLRCFGPLLSPIFLQAFSLTFLAEWGDRSQITTIILGAREVMPCVVVCVLY